jgi:hypothetical protein
MSLHSRIEDTRRWLHKARKRFWGAQHYLKETHKKLEQVDKDLKHAKDKEREHLLDKRKDLKRVQDKQRETVKRRAEVKAHLSKKLAHLKKQAAEKHTPDPPSGERCGFSVPSRSWNPYGRQIPNWMIPWLDKSRAAGWDGVVVSGVRTPAQSQGLCYAMCNAPTCPGKCAGVYSNHNMTSGQCYPSGALDVSDQYEFEQVQFQIGSPLRNNLPLDTVHFSVSGN